MGLQKNLWQSRAIFRQQWVPWCEKFQVHHLARTTDKTI